MMLRDATGLHQETARGDVELMGDAYTAEFVEFVAAIQQAGQPYVTGRDARRAGCGTCLHRVGSNTCADHH
jgi:hypothetical protein